VQIATFLGALAVAAAVVGSAGVSRASGLPAPIFLVTAGLGVSFLPGVSELALGPQLIFYGFLPPLVYSAAFFTSSREWRDNWQPIALLAVGLVLATLFAVAGAAAALFTGVGWGAAFVLGAVVAPTDPVAATGVVSRLRAPPRLRAILEGESLVNDGIALVIYSIAVSAALSGGFSVLHGVVRFAEVAAGGVALGLLLGWVLVHARRRINDPMIEITVSLLTPYVAFVSAEQAHVSGILATVTTGVFLGWRSEGLFQAQTRVQALTFWGVFTFLLESSLFVLLGAQFRVVASGVERVPPISLLRDALVVFAVVAVARLVWMFTVPHFVHALDVRFRELRSPTPWQERLVLGWAGMRGAVTLAVALAIPLRMGGRPLVLFLAFSLIVATIVVEGVTLPRLIRALGLARVDEATRRELEARVKLAEAALDRLEELAAEEDVEVSRVEPLRGVYEDRLHQLATQLQEEEAADGRPAEPALEELRLDLIRAERAMLRRLQREGAVDRETGRTLERELDLEESRLVA
jgi:CPA1 family monovalent cation:H+ antiporter